MNKNEEKFPAGSRVRITEAFGEFEDTVNGNTTPPSPAYREYHGLEVTVEPYRDHERYIRVRFDSPMEGMDTMLMLPNEIEVL